MRVYHRYTFEKTGPTGVRFQLEIETSGEVDHELYGVDADGNSGVQVPYIKNMVNRVIDPLNGGFADFESLPRSWKAAICEQSEHLLLDQLEAQL